MDQIVESKSYEETLVIGKFIGDKLRGNEVILLNGPLGAGKTALSKGIAVALKIEEKEVASPTYTLMNRYVGSFDLVHLDLYRYGEGVAFFPEIDEYLDEAVILVEWSQYLPKGYLSEKFAKKKKKKKGENLRVFTITTDLPHLKEIF